MLGETIGFLLRNLPAVLFVVALAVAMIRRGDETAPERFLSWILLLPIGVTGLWAGVTHVFFPTVAASHIGWQTSPFQFEVGMADLAVGVTASISFWRDLSFKAAAVSAASASVFLLGDAIGHIHQMIAANNFAPGNAGVPFFMDVICPVLSIGLLVAAWRSRPSRPTLGNEHPSHPAGDRGDGLRVMPWLMPLSCRRGQTDHLKDAGVLSTSLIGTPRARNLM